MPMLPKPTLTKTFIYPYGPSNSARDLNEQLGSRLIKREGSKYVYRPNHTVINWGSARRPAVLRGVPVLNDFDRVAVATSKLATFAALSQAGVDHVEVTQAREEAQEWAKTGRVFGRNLDTGSQGRGITVYEKGDQVGPHKFYTKYFRKERELRIHVLNGKVIFEQEKLKKKGVQNGHKYIRSHDRGWCFAFHHLAERPIPDVVRTLASDAVSALGLNFGAVDIGWNRESDASVFEVNTAPGIEETSLQAYVTAFKEI